MFIRVHPRQGVPVADVVSPADPRRAGSGRGRGLAEVPEPRRIPRRPPPRPPGPGRNLPPELTQFFRANAIKNLYLTAELLRILRLLDAQGIRAVPLKGPALAQSLYGDLALREFCDLDVLVQETDLRKARELLEAQGYHLDASLDPRGEAAHIRNEQDYPFRHPAKGILIELHWRFAPRWFAFPLAPSQVWPRLQPMHLAGREVPSFCPEHLFLFLAAHGAKHRWCALKWLCDLAQLIHRHPRLDWEWIVDQARRSHAVRVLLLGIHLAAQLGAPVPPELKERAQRDPKVQALAAGVWRDIENPASLRTPDLARAIRSNPD